MPALAALLDPESAPRVPAFVDPFTLNRPARNALASADHLLAHRSARIAGPPLPARTRRHLRKRIARVLPRYDALFRRAADDYQLPASLLAAQAYIESKWRPKAHYRGAAGMMMLSEPAAHVVGVTNRYSPRESVHGGARYLNRLRQRIPPDVPRPDRDLFALAAYNMGYAHLIDARILARTLGRNPNLWADIREVLPLMSEPRYYTELARGYVRGAAVVRYVERIRRYQALIAPHID
ncbi:transglycosylase SLT domain-containing protein [Salinisphaera sp. Q1T1-3]|uniref:transglycosylase SLT domain-containing protein n=1 Tax=Salinisphaera sp. Q1T1-3 TaxID=2321229 RepID=UPI001313EB41|nr:transglycosylase SLT domain-containing protein [Salinisphaera sp. Q1T1-3]